MFRVASSFLPAAFAQRANFQSLAGRRRNGGLRGLLLLPFSIQARGYHVRTSQNLPSATAMQRRDRAILLHQINDQIMATFVVLSLGLGTGKIRFGRRFSGKQSSAIIKRGGIQDRKDQVQVTITSGSSSFLQEKKKKKDERPLARNRLYQG